jgi:hypothetical protein
MSEVGDSFSGFSGAYQPHRRLTSGHAEGPPLALNVSPTAV